MTMGQPSPSSETAPEVARRLWSRAVGQSGGPEEIAEASDRMGTQLRAGLGRWIGTDGYRVLLGRAVVLARAEHPAVASISGLGGDEPATAAAVRAHGADKVAAGLVAIVAALIELLGRIIGEEMSVRLVEQIGLPSPRAVAGTEPKGARNG
jgi:hypothetical protein